MATIAERILEAVRFKPLDDDQLARRLGVSRRQAVNQAARRLEDQGLLHRYVGRDGKIVNTLPDAAAQGPSTLAAPLRPMRVTRAPASGLGEPITEDEVKAAVREFLLADGFDVQVAWGRTPGIDIDATHPDGRRWVIEAKAEKSVAGAQQHNYFVGMLGEVVQRMDDPAASYAIALPGNRQYHGLVDRLPALARERLNLSVFWVIRKGAAFVVTVDI